REMRYVADRALEAYPDAPEGLRGRALVASALTALAQGDYERSQREFEEALPLVRRAGDEHATAAALAKQGAARLLAGDREGARVRLDEAMAYTRDWSERHAEVAFARFWRAWLACREGEYDQAHELLVASRSAAVRHGLPTSNGHSTAMLARVELARGRTAEATALAHEALDIEVSLGDGWGI